MHPFIWNLAGELIRLTFFYLLAHSSRYAENSSMERMRVRKYLH